MNKPTPQPQLNPRQSKLLTILNQALNIKVYTKDGSIECNAILYEQPMGFVLCLTHENVIGIKREDVIRVEWNVLDDEK
ncbi:hypothetical protein [Sulfolobus ellipsoid virus 1]|uniref:Uncharacterized protein n=1 Tax=Sulfolobus ellipsoid virus 1 TaxID=2056194 RepID=A0A2H4RBQ1_9VIRU|nr:hypothetical protein FGG62_gp24 [Sulfolobus ellipsoid virus 1]ATY46502.1 hypothetical protein [Sulfolobus ellipsoid virus 1]